MSADPRKSTFRRIVKALASLKLAVVIIISIAALTAWGTIVESQTNAQIAQFVVYHSIYMYIALTALCVCLIAVMIDRLPWKKRHAPFILAHIGILILIGGSVITRYWGVDGSIAVGIGESSKTVTIGEIDLTVYASLDGDNLRKIYDYAESTGEAQAQLYGKDISKKPIQISVPDADLSVVEYYPFALRNEKIIPSDDTGLGPAIRFQLENPNVNVVQWLHQESIAKPAEHNFGPAKVILTAELPKFSNANLIAIKPINDKQLSYEIHSEREGKITRRGTLKAGETIETGWMGLKLRLIDFLPHSKSEITFKSLARPTELTTPAIKVRYKPNGTQEPMEYWLGLNSMVKLFSNQAVYIISYMNRRVDLGFPIKLKEFKVGRYQGTMRAASYESLVEVPEIGEHVISMNEPLHHGGYTIYQSSFSEDEQGQPTASIFSVNWDPGRWVKYLGSFLIVFGSFLLFYSKRKKK